MTTNEILEGNKLIAEFMGIKTKVYSDRPSIVYYDYNGFMNSTDQMEYHSSWDWLMPVVQKIETMDSCRYKIILHFEIAFIDDTATRPDSSVIRASGNNRLETAYNMVIKFIQWYNNKNI